MVFYLRIEGLNRDFGRTYNAKRISCRSPRPKRHAIRQKRLAGYLIKIMSHPFQAWQVPQAAPLLEVRDMSKSSGSPAESLWRTRFSSFHRSEDKRECQFRIRVPKVEPRNNFSAFYRALNRFCLNPFSKFPFLPHSPNLSDRQWFLFWQQ